MRREWIEMPKPTTATTTPESPSMRREWIEIRICKGCLMFLLSPSMRREWIEMQDAAIPQVPERPSPSMRREWIEILCGIFLCFYRSVSLHAEGVD